jgi:hypothetical protein
MFIENLPLSDNFDGKIIREAFTEEFISQRKPPDKRFFKRTEVESSDAVDGDEVIDRLKGLGYI